MKTVIVLCQFFVFLNSKLCQGPDGLVCCADFVWNKIENGCVPCNDGYFGINCVYTCPDLYFGKRCILRCNCSIGHCHHVHGCMTSRGPETQDDISMRLRMSENGTSPNQDSENVAVEYASKAASAFPIHASVLIVGVLLVDKVT
uniref:Protein draper-like isoform X2 n=1 Tax=Crassostrea virginica TaxID=6565 RepID=A0A8B8AYW8_CRAVI|nr:protein draper-like isoform X2 [Crassostrea virginica]